jgi:hypothetical protein
MTGRMCNRCGWSSNGSIVPKERLVKICWNVARNTFLD